MQASHLKALKNKHAKLEKNIHEEAIHPSRNAWLIDQLKKEKLHLKEEIWRTERACG